MLLLIKGCYRLNLRVNTQAVLKAQTMISSNQKYDEFFKLACKRGTPFEYQRHVAIDAEMSSLISVLIGVSKTTAMVAADI